MLASLLLALTVVPGGAAPAQGRQPALLSADVSPSPLPVSALEKRVRESFDPLGADDHGGLPKGTSIFPNPAGTTPETFGSPTPAPAPQSSGGPFNDDCANATIVPGNAVHYAQVVSTFGATTETCESGETCEAGGVGVSASVWYEYTPDRDGRVTIDTLGSSYNTVLSVFGSCAFSTPFGCISTSEIVCNDDYFFGTTSQVSLDVVADTTYRIKVAQVGFGFGGTLDFDLFFFPANDLCDGAIPILGTAFEDTLVPTQNADLDLCEPDESCEFNGVGTSNTVWYRFTAPCEGTLDLNTNGSSYDTVLSVWEGGCAVFNGVDGNCDFPSEVACDDDGGTGLNSQLLGVPVAGGEEYLVKVADYNTTSGGGFLEFRALFRPTAPPVAELTTPDHFGCICPGGSAIVGTASAGEETLAEWTLEYEPTSGGPRVLLASSEDPVEDGVLAVWNTASVPAGYYLLHLNVVAGCGATASSTRVVWVDGGFESLELQSPADGAVLGGIGCVEGTAWDTCFSSYSVEVAPAGTTAFTPVGGGPTARVNEALVPGGWDTAAFPDGDYDLRLVGVDDCGNSQEIVIGITIDNTAPTAFLTAPAACSAQYTTVEVVGTVADANLNQWSVAYSDPTGPGWVTIATGTGPVTNAVLASLDMAALPRCAYTLRLLASDTAAVNCDDPHVTEFTVSISNQFPPGAKKTDYQHP